jgi:probable HAF family extracellular repeat protein
MPRTPVVHRFVVAARLCAAGTAVFSPVALAQTITTIPPLPGGANSAVAALSADGSVVIGTSLVSGAPHPYRWTAATGSVELTAPAGTIARPVGVSGDGSVVAMYSGTGPNDFASYRWSSPTGTVLLALPPGAISSQVRGLSSDGNIFLGGANVGGTSAAWRLPFGSSYQFLGASSATGASADGAYVCGTSATATGVEAWRWSQATGLQPLGFLPGSVNTFAVAISGDGQTVVGYASHSSGDLAFRWTPATGIQPLGVLPGETISYALGTSGTGSVVVGWSGPRAWLWTAAQGLQDLNTLLPSRGIPLSGWSLNVGAGVSADGQTLVGGGIINNTPRGWHVRIGCYANCDGSTTGPVLNVTDFTCFLQRFAGGDAYANCDHSTTAPTLNVQDFTCFLARFAGGCP